MLTKGTQQGGRVQCSCEGCGGEGGGIEHTHRGIGSDVVLSTHVGMAITAHQGQTAVEGWRKGRGGKGREGEGREGKGREGKGRGGEGREGEERGGEGKGESS